MNATLQPVSQALTTLLADVVENQATTMISVLNARGCVLAQDQHADMAVPAYDNSAMDGYALSCDAVQAKGAQLKLSQTIAAGHVGQSLEPGTAARIFTGAPIPEGADAVVMQENARLVGDQVIINEKPVAGQNIRLRGHDIQHGSTVLTAGHRLQAQDIGLLASLGVAEIKVKSPLKVCIINTGDEVIAPGTALAPGQLYDSNSFTLAGLLEGLGMEVIRAGIVKDNLAATEQALLSASKDADCIITTGGVSVGDEDHVKQAVSNMGELALWKLAIKPGKPFSYGSVKGVPFFGLPGNPVAVFVTFVTLVRPYLLKMQGALNLTAPVFKIKAGFAINKPGSRQEYLRVKMTCTDGGEPVLETFPNQGSSVMTSLSWASGLAVIPVQTIVKKGQLLDYLPFSALL